MLTHIGSIDPELRDKLIYSSFSNWIINGQIPKDKLRGILRVCLDDQHLTLGLGEKDTDTVFTRSFSILIVAALLYYDNHIDSLLTEQEVIEVFERIVYYALSENDLRGYVNHKGWAHSIAHMADCLDELAKSRYLSSKELAQLLNVIKTKVKTREIVYTFGEDERMVSVVSSIIKRDLLNREQISEWLVSFCNFDRPTQWPELLAF